MTNKSEPTHPFCTHPPPLIYLQKFLTEATRVPRQAKPKEKPITAERPKSIVLTAKQATYVDETLKGATKETAAAKAGYGWQGAHVPEKSKAVQYALREARHELSSAAQISRADVIEGIMEGINMARLAADPATMIKGWTEVGKILGHYAPEVKKVEITDNQKRLQSKFTAMSDEELLRVIEGEATVVVEEALEAAEEAENERS